MVTGPPDVELRVRGLGAGWLPGAERKAIARQDSGAPHLGHKHGDRPVIRNLGALPVIAQRFEVLGDERE